MKFQIAAFISSVVMIIFIRYNLSTSPPQEAPHQPSFHQIRPPPPPSSETQTITTPSYPAKPERTSSNLTSFIQKNRDYRVAFESLLANPTDISGIYAKNIIIWCNALRSINFSSLPVSTSTRQDRARIDLESLCSTFTEEELSSNRLAGLSEDPRIKGRFVNMLNDRHQRIATQEGKRTIFRAALEQKDPLLLEETFSEQFINQEGIVYFNGTEYRQRYAPTVSSAAWRSATCEGTYTECGPQDRVVLELCAIHGSCVDSRYDAYREIIRMTGGADEVELYDRLYTQFVETIRLGNVEAFIRKLPPGAPGGAAD